MPVSSRTRSAPRSREPPLQLAIELRPSAGETGLARGVTPGVDVPPGPTLRVVQRHQAGIGQLALPGVRELHRDHVVLAGQPAECRLVAVARKSETMKQHRAPAEHRLEVLESRGEVGAGAGRLEGEQLAEDAEGVAPALPGRNHLLDAIGKEEGADPIVIARGRQRQDGTDLGGQVPLGPEPAAESLGGAEVHHEADGELPLLQVALDVRRRPGAP